MQGQIPPFISVEIPSYKDLYNIDNSFIKKYQSPLLLITPENFSLHELALIESECQRLGITKVGFMINRDNLINETFALLDINIGPVELSDEELFNLLDFTQDESCERMNSNESQVPESIKSTVRIHAKGGRNLVLGHEKQILSVCVTFDMEIEKKSTTLISWIWIKPGLSNEMRQQIHLKLKQWLLDNSMVQLFATININNKRSIRFFTKMGFEPKCLFLKV
jgi:hypothetical protein